jgi:hypothetical protein
MQIQGGITARSKTQSRNVTTRIICFSGESGVIEQKMSLQSNMNQHGVVLRAWKHRESGRNVLCQAVGHEPLNRQSEETTSSAILNTGTVSMTT